MPRTVSLIVVDRDGDPLGALPPFDVDIPYWQEVDGVVAGARARYGVEVTVLRVLADHPPARTSVGGPVSYLVEADRLPSLFAGPVRIDLSPHPLRHPYAEPGGPAESLRWARAALGDDTLTARQLRTWNLSTIWRLDTATGIAWLKQVPSFFAHEAAVLRWVAEHGPAGLVPPLLAVGPRGRMLLGHVTGDDLYGAGPAVREAIAAAFHPVQVAAIAAVTDLLAAGVPDARTDPLLARLTAVAVRHGAGQPGLNRLLADLPDRLAEVEECGLPDTLVHGDLHPGNARGSLSADAIGAPVGRPVVLDWGDSFIGSPAFDLLRLCEGLDPAATTGLVDAWAQRWQATCPGSDPARACRLLRPVAELRNAAVYAYFLDQIEPAEHPYHALDVSECLTRAAGLTASE